MTKHQLLAQIEFLKSNIIRMSHDVEFRNQELEDMNRRYEDLEIDLATMEAEEDTTSGC